ncbi:MAG: hypothetical protein R3C13_05575 [Hyphomonas sp.]|uniref:hypothetical protein n=1 Tax=Hyphomonas sp. TaxID=87 RepID=UPI0035286950
MKFASVFAAAALAALVSACASAPAETADNGEQLVCRSIKVTGTRFPEKDCRTVQAWDQFDDEAESNADDIAEKL